MKTGNGMNDRTLSQSALPLDPVNLALASLEGALREREREIDILRREVDRHKRQSDDAQGRAAMVQAAFDRHFEHCGRDDAAIQRLIARLAEATSQIDEQAAIIDRRNHRIAAMQKELGQSTYRGFLQRFGYKSLASRLRQIFLLRRT